MPIDITKPTVGGDGGVWGNILNAALDALANGALPLSGAGATITGPFAWRAANGDDPVNAKPSTDTHPSVFNLLHDSPVGYLFHITFGPNTDHLASAGIGLGIDNDGIGLLIANKGVGRGIVGTNQSTITSSTAYLVHLTQQSQAAMVRLEQQANNTGPMLQTVVSGTVTPDVNQPSVTFGDKTGTAGEIFALDGRLVWQSDVIVRDRTDISPSTVELQENEGIPLNQQQRVRFHTDGMLVANYSGTPGLWFPFQWKGAKFSPELQLTSAGPQDIDAAVTDVLLRFRHNQMGFYGAPAVSQPTSVAPSPNALSAALTTLGLITEPVGFATVAQWEASRASTYYVGHRGSGDVIPEHTIEAYEYAYQSGAQVMEISVGQTSDGQLICMHDLTYDRTTSTTGTVNTLPSTILKGVTVQQPQLGPSWIANPPKVPLFEDVLRRFAGKMVLCCEAKLDAAYPAMVAMIERLGFKSSVIIKAFYTSSRLAQAKAAGYKTFVYFGSEADITAPNIATVVAGNADYFVIPAYSTDSITLITDAHVTQCVAANIPVWVYPVHRRVDAAHMLGLGVKGVITASFPYVSTAVKQSVQDTWKYQTIAAGNITREPGGGNTPGSNGFAPTWNSPNELRLGAVGSQHFMMLGSLCPLVNAAATYTIDFDFQWVTPLPADTTTNITFAFGHADDGYYAHQFGRGTGYHAIVRPNGNVQLFTHVDGSTTGTQIGTTGVTLTAPAVAGTWYHATVAVTPTTVTFTVNDGSNHVVTATDSTRRGGYVHIGKSSTDGVAGFRTMVVT